MKKELPHYNIGASYGGNQEWFNGFMMRIGGCAAETAIELCIYSDLYKGTKLCPFEAKSVTKEKYISFGDIMKPYLHPRMSGIDSLDIYIDGFYEYLKDKESRVTLSGLEGSKSYEEARGALISQIDGGRPVAYLCLYHSDKRFKDYEWHWFIINGYDDTNGALKVKAVTYSTYEWLDFDALWNTGKMKKGGMVFLNYN